LYSRRRNASNIRVDSWSLSILRGERKFVTADSPMPRPPVPNQAYNIFERKRIHEPHCLERPEIATTAGAAVVQRRPPHPIGISPPLPRVPGRGEIRIDRRNRLHDFAVALAGRGLSSGIECRLLALQECDARSPA